MRGTHGFLRSTGGRVARDDNGLHAVIHHAVHHVAGQLAHLLVFFVAVRRIRRIAVVDELLVRQFAYHGLQNADAADARIERSNVSVVFRHYPVRLFPFLHISRMRKLT